MKLENLEVGMKIPNYRKLCELLEEPEKSGASKRAQICAWEQYVSFEHQGHAYIVKEIRTVPLMSQDGRKKYMQYVEPLLLHALNKYTPSSEEIEHTFQDWSVEIGLTSGRAYSDSVVAEYQELVRPGYGKAEPAFSTIAIRRAKYEIAHRTKTELISTAESLQKKGIISCKSNVHVVQNSGTRLATDDEVAYVKQAKKRVLNEMQLSSMFYVQMSPKKNAEYYERLHTLYREEKGWEKTYELYAIKGLDWERIAAYASVDLIALKNKFHAELMKSIREELWKEADRGEELNLLLFDILDEMDSDKKAPFTMNRMLAGEIEYLVEELL